MARYKELYSNSVNNAEIAISGNAIYARTATDQERTVKHGSFNGALVQNNSGANDIEVELDGLSNKVMLIPAKNSLVIAPNEGIAFNSLKITNLSGAAVVTAGDLYIRYSISEYIGS